MSEILIYKEFFEGLNKDNYFGRLGKCFKTINEYYFLDTGTGKIAKVQENVFRVLNELFETNCFESLLVLDMEAEAIADALEVIKANVEKENILSAPPVHSMVGDMTLNLESLLSNSIKSITLEVTQECNLRCKYCIYNPQNPEYRDFEKKYMSIETAKQAIDFLKSNTNKNMEEKLFIGYYGGEPLLNFPLIRQSIEYAKSVFTERALFFSITTNGILLNEEICDFVVENDISMTISLDGPEELHDTNRITKDGKGSYESVVKGIKTLINSFEKREKEPKFMINVVCGGPDYDVKYDLIQKYFTDQQWLSEGVQILCSGVNRGPRKMHYVLPQSKEEKCYHQQLDDVLASWSNQLKEEYGWDKTNFADHTLENDLIKIHRRLIVDEPHDFYHVNGCCTPGHQKAYITVAGDILPCERVGSYLPSLGHVIGGFDIPKVKKYYVDDYIKGSIESCKNCWAIHLCGLCYVNCYDEQGMVMPYKHMLCIDERAKVEASLVRYHNIYENSPEKLNELNDAIVI